MSHCKIDVNPINKVVLKGSLDKLVEEVGGNQFVDICVREAHCKRLENSEYQEPIDQIHCHTFTSGITPYLVQSSSGLSRQKSNSTCSHMCRITCRLSRLPEGAVQLVPVRRG